MQDAVLYPEHNLMTFYTWGDTRLLPAAGRDRGDPVRFVSQPAARGRADFSKRCSVHKTGNAADADLRHRCAVRLTQVATLDAYGDPPGGTRCSQLEPGCR